MYVKAGSTVDLVGFFVAERVGKTGLTPVPTVDLVEWRQSGPALVGSYPAVELGGGLYGYRHTAQQDCTVLAIFKTVEATVDVQHVPGMALDPAKESSVNEVKNEVLMVNTSLDDLAPKTTVDSMKALLTEKIDLKLSELPAAISGSISSLNGEQIASAVVDSMFEDLALNDSIIMGQGTGTKIVDTTMPEYEVHKVTSDGRKGLKGVIVRAFASTEDSVDWTKVIARSETDALGNFRLYLNPGRYTLSFEFNGTQVSTGDIVIAP